MFAAGLGGVATTAALAGPQIVQVGGAIGTKLLPLLASPVGLIALLGLAAIGVKKFYDSMARKEVDEFAESIKGMTEEVKAQTKAHLENVIAVSKARLQNREFSTQFAVITDQLETDERKLAHLNQETEAHTDAVEEATDAVEENTAAVAANTESADSAKDSWKEWTAEVEALSAQMDLAKRINEEMMSLVDHAVGGCNRGSDRPVRAARPGGVRPNRARAGGPVLAGRRRHEPDFHRA